MIIAIVCYFGAMRRRRSLGQRADAGAARRDSPSPKGGSEKGDPTIKSPKGHFVTFRSPENGPLLCPDPPFRIPLWAR